MKPIPKSSDRPPLLAFGAHPDDIEFGCGGVIALATRPPLSRRVHFVICSRGEAATNGTPKERTAEAKKAASILGASVEFLELDGDAHLEFRAAHTITLAEVIRRARPDVILAPSVEEKQHPDHLRLGTMVRDAARLARYGGLKELRESPVHTIGQLFFYAGSPGAEPRNITPVFIDISAPDVVATWTAAMEAHGSQMKTRNYVELQLARTRVNGLLAGVQHAMALYPNDPLVFDSLAALNWGANRF